MHDVVDNADFVSEREVPWKKQDEMGGMISISECDATTVLFKMLNTFYSLLQLFPLSVCYCVCSCCSVIAWCTSLS